MNLPSDKSAQLSYGGTVHSENRPINFLLRYELMVQRLYKISHPIKYVTTVSIEQWLSLVLGLTQTPTPRSGLQLTLTPILTIVS